MPIIVIQGMTSFIDRCS